MSRGFGPDDLLSCYARGVFPMADGRDDPRLFLVDPEARGIMPLDAFHVPSRLARTVRRGAYEVSVDAAFVDVVEACAAATADRPDTWINDRIVGLYAALHRRGRAHSVECRRDGVLVGGLYGVSLGAAFFGESMFSRETDASKVALVHLVAILLASGYDLLDTQFTTAHLAQFGTREITRADYRVRLDAALSGSATFPGPPGSGPAALADRIAQALRRARPEEPVPLEEPDPRRRLGALSLAAIAAAEPLLRRPRNG